MIKLQELSINKNIIFKNAHIIDPSQNIDFVGDLWLEDGKISKIVQGSDLYSENANIVDCSNLIICPGFVDTQIKLNSVQERCIKDLSINAAQSGITSLIITPETSPIIDTPELVALLINLFKNYAEVNMYASGALSKQLQGKEMAEYGLMQEAGALFLSNGNFTIENTAILRQMMSYAADLKLPIYSVPSDFYLGGSEKYVNQSLLATWMGLKGCCVEAEIIGLERELRLSNLAKNTYHAHISSSISCDIIAKAKSYNNCITCYTSIFHLCFNENDIGNYDIKYKMFPPLRDEANRIKLIEALANGNINNITSSHNNAGSTLQTEDFNNSSAPNNGMQLLLPLALRLYHNNQISLYSIIKALTTAPADIFNLKAGSLKYSDFIIIDPNKPYLLGAHALQGTIEATFVDGKLIYLNR